MKAPHHVRVNLPIPVDQMATCLRLPGVPKEDCVVLGWPEHKAMYVVHKRDSGAMRAWLLVEGKEG
jgi:hypothetical protein